MADSITIREFTEKDVGVKITDHERDLSDTVVGVYAFPTYTSERVKLASALGAAEGEEFVLDVNTDPLEPGHYELEILADGRLVYPDSPQKSKLSIEIIDTKFNN